MIRVFYLTRANLTLTRAHSHNILKTAEALGGMPGFEVTLALAENFSEIPSAVFEKNNIKKAIPFISVGQNIFQTLNFLSRARKNFDVLYFRELGLWPAAIAAKVFRKKVIFEVHRKPERFFERAQWLIAKRYLDGIIAITHALEDVISSGNIPIKVAHCAAAEPELFKNRPSKNTLREKLGLPQDKFLICSMGTFQLYKMVSLYQGLSKSDKNISLILLGAKESEIGELKKRFIKLGIRDRVIIITRVAYRETPNYLLASDALVVPEGKDAPGFAPTKIYEYLAAGRPIISYKNKAISEVLEDNMSAIFADPPIPENWKKAFEKIMNDNQLSNTLSEAAIKKSNEFSWARRAQIISELIRLI